MPRTLTLKREHLVPLTTTELAGVAGGALPTTPVEHCLAWSNIQCHTRGTTCAC